MKEANEHKAIAQFSEIYPKEKASLLHGDLWGGNAMMTTKGFAIYDPAVYYGHREMDIAMTQLFGGFDNTYIDAYNELYPLDSSWKDRLELSQLYPLLVHAKLFGGSYWSSCKRIIRKNLL